MKPLILLFTLVILYSSCDENDRTTTLFVPSGQKITYPLGNIPTEGGIEIDQAPLHATISQIVIDTINGGLVYEYQSKDDFKGVDELTLKHSSSPGDSNFTFSYQRIVITVE